MLQRIWGAQVGAPSSRAGMTPAPVGGTVGCTKVFIRPEVPPKKVTQMLSSFEKALADITSMEVAPAAIPAEN